MPSRTRDEMLADFLRSLVDAREGLVAAVREVLPGAAWAALPGPLLVQRVQGYPRGSARRP